MEDTNIYILQPWNMSILGIHGTFNTSPTCYNQFRCLKLKLNILFIIIWNNM